MNIISNGSKWAGEEPDSIEELLEVLKHHPLDPDFEECGNFFYKLTEKDLCKGSKHLAGPYTAFGNFWTISHGFNINGTKEEMEPLRKAIRANQKRDDYKTAKEGRNERNQNKKTT